MIRIMLSTRLGERRMTQSDLDDLDLICEALDCTLSDLLIYEPNEVHRVKEVRRIPKTVSKNRKK